MILNKRRRGFHSSRVKLAVVSMSASWFFGVNIIDLDLAVQVDSVRHSNRRNSVGSGHVSHCRTSAFDDHVDHRFTVLEKQN